MRPGPGLVVMALAFISGARRGSSSSISSATATPTAAAAVATSAAAAAAAAASSAAAAGATTSDGGGRGRGRGGGGGGVATTLPSTSESSSSSSFARSSGSYLLPIFLPHHLDFALQFHPQLPPREYSQYQAHSESWITSRIADRRQQRRRRRESSSSRDIAGRAGGTGLGAKGGGTSVTAGTDFGEANNHEETEEDHGLTVQFPSSQAYDEDQDIFALVAEDDLLSEESFDRLIKLNEDADEEDYNLQQQQQQLQGQQQPEAETEIDTEPESETETETETETEREAETETETETEQQQQDESRLIDEGVLQHNDNSNSHSKEFANSYDNNNNKREASGHILDAQTAQLIGHKDNSLSAVATTESAGAGAGAGAADSNTTTSLPAPVDLKKSILGTATSLTRLNPWISACDLAQPGTATDLQGQCSAGTLPMAWVDEGPGPPICPRSCAEQQQQRPAASKAKRSATSNNKVKYFVNYKTAQMRLRRGGEYAMDATESNSPAASERPTSTTDDQEDVESSFSFSTTTEEAMAEADGKVPEPTLSYSHLHAQEPILVHQQGQGQWQEEQEEQQQCLEYLGDSAESSPQHLCDLQSPAHLLERLRVLRLRNCCERSAFSALHTLALNASLSDRSECIRVLTDLLDVDGLANRITCELAEILFRFDCRQVYSLINQCDDCKEAYRRWVCSTLVPYFAEPKDVSPKPKDDGQANTGKSKRSARSAAMAMADHRVDGIKHKSLKLISNNNKSNNGNNMNERQINQKHDKSSNANANANASANKDIDRSVEEAIGRDLAQTFYDVVGLSKPRHGGEQVLPDDEPAPDADSEVETDTDRERERDSERDKEMDRERDRETEKEKKTEKETETDTEAEAEQQSNNFISTANNSDPRATDPVISKLQKRSTRKTEFRKRRRIRPCLSVCQTVEQKCPYLLPADRAPALPTQYAGEPTFLCLDQNIPETGAQLEKSSYGPNDCCYSYCNGPASGICTICPDFSQSRMEEQEGAGPGNSTRRVHNITISLSSHPGEHARAKSVALALRNVSQTNSDPDAVETLLERLPYYARHDGVFYYDEEGEMPQASLSGDCAVVPTVTTRCTIPYYASGTEAVARPPTQLLIWLSALLGLLSSCGAARQRWSCQWSSGCGGHRGRHAGHSVACEASCHEQELVKSRGSGPRTTAGLPSKEKLEVPVPTRSWLWSRSWHTYKLTCSKVRFFSSRSKFKGESGEGRLTNYKDSRSLRAGIQWSRGAGCFRTRNYRYFYYYNYNINDWWRRWWRCLSSGAL